MKLRTRTLLAVMAPPILCLLCGAPAFAQNAYITNSGSDTVSVIDTEKNKTIATIPIPLDTTLYGVAVSSSGGTVYVSGYPGSMDYIGAIAVIDTATNSYTGTVSLNNYEHVPVGLAVSPDGSRLYAADDEGYLLVIDTATNSLITTLSLDYFGGGEEIPVGITVSPDGSKVYIAAAGTDPGPDILAVMDTATNSWDTVAGLDTDSNGTFGGMIWFHPAGVAVTPGGSKIYVAGGGAPVDGTGANDTLMMVDTKSFDTGVVTSVPTGAGADTFGLAITPDGKKLYAGGTTYNESTSSSTGNISVIDTATDKLITTIPFGDDTPMGLAITPDGSKVYVANSTGNGVAVIDTATDTLRHAQIPVGSDPIAFGEFIIDPSYAGTPGRPTCRGRSDAALAVQFGSVAAAAQAMGFPTTAKLTRSILAFCQESPAS
jgi:YVTN family beta-propeller protein